MLPYKSVAGALLLAVFLGPIGLLYASFWGGTILSLIGIVVVSCRFFFPIALLWVLCCIWSVRSAERYNRRLAETSQR